MNKYYRLEHSNEQTGLITARRTAVDVTATVIGQTAGRVAGAALGQALIPIPGVGSLANKELDKGIKPKKKGWSWPW